MTEDYVRNTRLVRVIDGDTVVLDIDLSFGLTLRRPVRILGINCPEVHGPTAAAGLAAKRFTETWFARGADVQVKTYVSRELDDFGRVLAEVARDADSLGAALLASGNAVAYTRSFSRDEDWR
jgi:endonuclease YncB( thermonuclease family)